MIGIAKFSNVFDCGRPDIFQSYSMTCAHPKRPEMHSRDTPATPTMSLIILKQNAYALAMMDSPD